VRFLEEKPTRLQRLERWRTRDPELEKLYAREDAPLTAAAALPYAAEVYRAVLRGERVSPNTLLRMIRAYDFALLPDFEHSPLPAAQREDDEASGALADAVADALTAALEDHWVPVFALDPPGPVSARVFTRIEARLVSGFLQHLELLSDRLDELGEARAPLGRAEHDWFVASDLRARFREVERNLGEAVSAQLFGRYMRVYSALGVRISSARGALPPLAQAIFKSLAQDAKRYGDEENEQVMVRNVRVTDKFE
jgi:hypothetical protein